MRTRQSNVHGKQLILCDMLDVVKDAVLSQHARHIAVQRRDAHVLAALQPGVVRGRQQHMRHGQLHMWPVNAHEQVGLQCKETASSAELIKKYAVSSACVTQFIRHSRNARTGNL